MRRLKIKINWFKTNKNNFFHKIISFIFPIFSPSLKRMLKADKLMRTFTEGFEKGLYDDD